jgi:hypothetical protein
MPADPTQTADLALGGRYVSIYVNAEHAFVYVAGLRLDTVEAAEYDRGPNAGKPGAKWRRWREDRAGLRPLALSAARNPAPSVAGVVAIVASNALHCGWPLALGALGVARRRATRALGDVAVGANVLASTLGSGSTSACGA